MELGSLPDNKYNAEMVQAMKKLDADIKAQFGQGPLKMMGFQKYHPGVTFSGIPTPDPNKPPLKALKTGTIYTVSTSPKIPRMICRMPFKTAITLISLADGSIMSAPPSVMTAQLARTDYTIIGQTNFTLPEEPTYGHPAEQEQPSQHQPESPQPGAPTWGAGYPGSQDQSPFPDPSL
jgi:hypothetical protein